MKKFILLFISLFAISFSGKAQEGFEALLFADPEDTNQLTEAYILPAMKGLIYGMNSGWYHTAKVHKSFGFDLSIGLNASIVPSKDEMFKFADLNLTSVTSTTPEAATVAGSEDLTPLVNVATTFQGQPVTASFNMPGGVKESLPLNAMPTPAIQLNLGLPAKFEVSLRLVPKVGNDDVKGELLGLGLKKEITGWFGPLDKLPLHVSLMGAFTNMKVSYAISDEDSGDNIEITDGLVELKLNSYTVQALASLNFPIINVYGGFGYTSGTSTLKMLGTYELDYNNGLVTRTLVDPLDLGFDASGFRTTLGARLSLGFFKIYGDYTLQEYNTLSLGVAFSIR